MQNEMTEMCCVKACGLQRTVMHGFVPALSGGSNIKNLGASPNARAPTASYLWGEATS